jgi:hypothetical protein
MKRDCSRNFDRCSAPATSWLYTYVQVCFAGVSFLGHTRVLSGFCLPRSDWTLFTSLEDVIRQVVAMRGQLPVIAVEQ